MSNQEHVDTISQVNAVDSRNSTERNDADTYEAFYETHQAFVRLRIFTLLRSRPDLIDDAMQETWIKVWWAYPPASSHNLKGWLWLIAQNTVRDTIRRANVRLFHYPSLEGYLDSSESKEDTNSLFFSADPAASLPESLDRRVLIRKTWKECRPCDRQALIDYTNNKPVSPRDVYIARRNFKAKYHRYERRMEASA